MKTIELYKKLDQLIKAGHGDRVIQIMDVQAGVTFATDVLSVSKAAQYDGDRVWIFVGDTHPPEWMDVTKEAIDTGWWQF